MALSPDDKTSREQQNFQKPIWDFLKNVFRAFLSYISRYLLFGVHFLVPKENDSTISQFERARKESKRILTDVTGSSRRSSAKFGNSCSKKHRIPLLYQINENKSILLILQGDITRTKVDAIVNAANEHMTGGGGVDGIIHRAAGDELYHACKAHKEITRGTRLPTGHSRILLSYDMSSTTYYIINTAGPVYYRREAEKCAKQLESCYKTSLALADLYDLESVGFTAISCGIFGYPANEGAEVALRTVDQHAASVPVVVFVLWDDDIYDAWERKAKELNFTPYDPDGDYQEKSIEQPIYESDNRRSSNTFNPTVIDASSPLVESNKKKEDSIDDLVARLPSVPNHTPDSQDVESMEHENQSITDKPPLTTGTTMQLENVHLGNKDSTTNPDSVPLSVSEESNQSTDDGGKTGTNANDSQPSSKPETSGEPKRKLIE